jgi:hypothetical protein
MSSKHLQNWRKQNSTVSSLVNIQNYVTRTIHLSLPTRRNLVHLAHADANMSNRQRRRRRFSFFGTSLPPKRGAGWGGSAQRARGNEMNTAKRQIGFEPADLLYSESLTEVTKKKEKKIVPKRPWPIFLSLENSVIVPHAVVVDIREAPCIRDRSRKGFLF